jgi:putative membrane protein
MTINNRGFYARYKREDLILRDYLAADRTVLANERTFMAFIRTAIALAAAGGSLIHFFETAAIKIGGAILIVLAVATMVWGVQRYLHYRRHLALLGMSDWHQQNQQVKPGEGV